MILFNSTEHPPKTRLEQLLHDGALLSQLAGLNLEEAEETRVFEPTPLIFTGQPDSFFDEGQLPYRGQEAAKRRLAIHIRALGPANRLKVLFTGPAGTGKTTLARIVARKLIERHEVLGLPGGAYYELLPAQVREKTLLDEFMEAISLDPYSTVFIDEVHDLTNLESFFHVLHDSGALRYPLSNGSWLDIPRTISWLAATTNPGKLDETVGGAMRRRLEPELRLEVPTKDDLAKIVTDSARVDNMSIHPDAAYEIAERSLFPWQAKLIYGEAERFARVEGKGVIDPGAATETFEIMQIDQNGLLPEDRDIIRTLLRAPYEMITKKVTRYRMSEEAVCASAGVDRQTYKQRIQPKLLRQGLLTTVGGQSLTPKAVEVYGWLKDL